CLVIAELLSRHLVVILNKIDLLPSSSRNEKIRSVSSKLRNVFSQTVFGSEIPIIPVAAHPRQEDEGGKTPLSSSSSSNWNVGAVIEALASLLTTQQRESLLPLSSSPSSPSFSCSSLLDKLWLDQRCEWNMIRGRRRNASTNDEKEERCICCERVGPVPPSPFYLVYDHCFLLKGKGTIFTGTVLSGCLHIGDSVCILTSSSPLGAAGAGAAAAASKGNSSSSFSSYKVKGLQTFHRQVESACRGQRVALCLTGVSGSDASHLERGALCDPQCVPPIADGCLAVVERIRFYKPSISSGMKFHCTVGHTTVMCVASFFGSFSSSEEEDEEKEKERDSRSTSCLTSTSVSYSSLNVGRLISGGPSESYASPEDHKRNARQPSQRSSSTWPETIDLKCTYTHLDELVLLQQDERKGKERRFAGDSCQKQKSPAYHDMRDELPQEKKKKERLRSQFAILSFEKPIIVPSRSVFICSKLDMDTSSPQCRLAFFGNMLTPLTAVPPPSQGLSQNEKKKSSSHSTTSFKAPMPSIFYHPYVQELPVYKPKKKTGYVERFVFDPPCKCGGEGGGKAVEKTSEASACKAFSLIGRSLFKSSQHVSRFVGFKVKICPRSAETDNGYTEKDEEKQTSKKKKEDCHVGTIEKAFGNKGKFIVQLTEGMSCNELRSIHGAEEGTEGVSKTTGFEIILEYRKKVYDKTSDTLTQKDS
ncbi:elongation factor tu gtp binding domain-containing protein, partial [Cystoisospora suis]